MKRERERGERMSGLTVSGESGDHSISGQNFQKYFDSSAREGVKAQSSSHSFFVLSNLKRGDPMPPKTLQDEIDFPSQIEEAVEWHHRQKKRTSSA